MKKKSEIESITKNTKCFIKFYNSWDVLGVSEKEILFRTQITWAILV